MSSILSLSLLFHSLLLALYIVPKCAALDLPQEDFWSEDRKSVLWADFMAEAIYQKCPSLREFSPMVLGQEYEHPMPEEDILRIAQRYEKEDDPFMGVASWNFHSFAKGSLSNLSNLDLVKLAVVPVWFTLLSVGVTIVALVLCILLPCLGCCKTSCCKAPSCVPYYGCCLATSVVAAMLLLLASFGAAAFAGWKTKNVGTDIEHVVCQVYRLPYTVIFGVEHDQNEYFKNLGRDEFDDSGNETWTGVLDLMERGNDVLESFIGEDEASLLSTVRALASDITEEFIQIIEDAVDDSKKLADSFEKTGDILTALQEETPHNHICLVCTVASSGALTGPLKGATEMFGDLKGKTGDVVGNLDSAFDRPEIQDAKAQMQTFVDLIYASISQITVLYTMLALADSYVQRAPVSNPAWYGLLAPMVTPLVLGLLYAFLFCFGWCKYRKPREKKPSKVLTGCFFLTWCFLLYWAAIFLLFTTFLLFVLGPLGEICVLSDELLVRGNYQTYPWIADFLGPNVGLSGEKMLEFLKSVFSLAGDGDLSIILDIPKIKTDILDGIQGALDTFKEGQEAGIQALKDADVEQVRNALLAGTWVIIPNVVEIKNEDPELLVAFPEVLLSGLQMKDQSVDDLFKGILKESVDSVEIPDKLPEVLPDGTRTDGGSEDGPRLLKAVSSKSAGPKLGTKEDDVDSKDKKQKTKIDPEVLFQRFKDRITGIITDGDIGSVIYGFEEAETLINKEFNTIITNTRLCFGRYTTCHTATTTPPTTPKIITSEFDDDKDPDLASWKEKFDEAESGEGGLLYSQIVASIKVMVWKLRLLDGSHFVTINADGEDTAIKYDQYVSPDPTQDVYINKLVNGMTVDAIASITTLVGKVGTAGDGVYKTIETILETVPEFKGVHARILAEFIAFKDPLCRGLLRPISSAVVMWCIVGILQIPLCIMGYRFWTYLKDMEIRDEESDWKRDRETSFEDLEKFNPRRKREKKTREKKTREKKTLPAEEDSFFSNQGDNIKYDSPKTKAIEEPNPRRKPMKNKLPAEEESFPSDNGDRIKYDSYKSKAIEEPNPRRKSVKNKLPAEEESFPSDHGDRIKYDSYKSKVLEAPRGKPVKKLLGEEFLPSDDEDKFKYDSYKPEDLEEPTPKSKRVKKRVPTEEDFFSSDGGD